MDINMLLGTWESAPNDKISFFLLLWILGWHLQNWSTYRKACINIKHKAFSIFSGWDYLFLEFFINFSLIFQFFPFWWSKKKNNSRMMWSIRLNLRQKWKWWWFLFFFWFLRWKWLNESIRIDEDNVHEWSFWKFGYGNRESMQILRYIIQYDSTDRVNRWKGY